MDGVPVQETDVANDPFTRLTKSYIPAIVHAQSEYPVSHIGLDIVLEGEKETEQAIREHIKNGNRIIIMDAVTDEEIEDIENAMASIKEYQMISADPGQIMAPDSKAYTGQYEGNEK